jgi:tetratricopeptide (TPR) repeat protein
MGSASIKVTSDWRFPQSWPSGGISCSLICIRHMGVIQFSKHRRAPRPLRPWSAVLCVALMLGVGSASGLAQQPSSTFDELAAQAAAARDQQNLPLAIDLYTRAEQLKPDWQEGWWYLTLLQYSSNQFQGAIDAANHLLQLVPHAVPAMALRGLSEFELADYKASLRDLETAVDHGAANDPHNEQIIRYHLALDLTRASRFQDALAQYKLLAAKNISAPEIMAGIGLAGMRSTSFPSEVNAADLALYQAAGVAGFAFLFGDSLQADTLFQQVFAKYPQTPNLHLFYGVLLLAHDADLAADQFQQEVAIAPSNDPARDLLAFSLMISGRYQEALPEAERAYAASPDIEMAQIALGRSLGETGNIDRGVALLQKALDRDPDNLEAHMGLAALYGRAGRKEDAYRERMLCLKLAK